MLQMLVMLDLAGNKIEQVPIELGSLTVKKLQSVKLKANPLADPRIRRFVEDDSPTLVKDLLTSKRMRKRHADGTSSAPKRSKSEWHAFMKTERPRVVASGVTGRAAIIKEIARRWALWKHVGTSSQPLAIMPPTSDSESKPTSSDRRNAARRATLSGGCISTAGQRISAIFTAFFPPSPTADSACVGCCVALEGKKWTKRESGRRGSQQGQQQQGSSWARNSAVR